MDNSTPIIQVKDLKKTYGLTHAVDGITFDVHPGEIFGLIGPNGAGKTTTVEIMAGLRRPTSGSVRVLGLDPQSQARELRLRTGVQLQEAALPDRLKVWEALDLFASFYPKSKPWQPLLETWGLAEKRQTAFAALSGGQRQRLFIALALINNPELVFLDELTTGLDPQARRATWEMIREIRRQGKTIVLVTHFMDEAEKLCDRVGIIDGGRLAALDTPHRLIAGLGAENRVRFTTSNGFDPNALRGLPGFSRAVRTDDEVTVFGRDLPGGPSLLLQVAGALDDLGQQPADLHSEPATLEDVFLALTGRQIRA